MAIFDQLKEKLVQGITKVVMANNVYKIVLTVCRHETMEQER